MRLFVSSHRNVGQAHGVGLLVGDSDGSMEGNADGALDGESEG